MSRDEGGPTGREIIRKDLLTAPLEGAPMTGRVEIRQVDLGLRQEDRAIPLPLPPWAATSPRAGSCSGSRARPGGELALGDAFFEPARAVIRYFDNPPWTEPASFIAFYLPGAERARADHDAGVTGRQSEEVAMLHSDDGLLGQARSWKAEGRKVALATVVSTWGSSPRPAGSMLVVDDGGRMQGSVSGGCIEGAVIQEAMEIMEGAEPRLLEFGVSDEQAWDVGLACGGKVQVWVEAVT